jgi:lysylphosphatidylglycerol synthetase-like protein (DUF2156 family)
MAGSRGRLGALDERLLVVVAGALGVLYLATRAASAELAWRPLWVLEIAVFIAATLAAVSALILGLVFGVRGARCRVRADVVTALVGVLVGFLVLVGLAAFQPTSL